VDRQRSVAAGLALGSGLVIASGVAAVAVRDPSNSAPAATDRAVVADTPTPTPTVSGPAFRPAHKPPAVLGERHARERGKHPRTLDELPFTGPFPMSPAVALGLLLVAAGSWSVAAGAPRLRTVGSVVVEVQDVDRGLSVLARVPTGVRRPRSDDAIGRLRSPGHQL
jgi:hypothetical protein